jgi:phosphohistidine phosphatase
LSTKKIIFIRHAQAVDQAANDFDRPLDSYGHAQSKKVAEALAQALILPDFLIFSSAIRTSETALAILEKFNLKKEQLLVTPSLYNCEKKNYLPIIAELNEAYSTVAIVGHNPGISLAANYFCPKVQAFERAETYGLEFKKASEWKTLTASGAEIFFHFRP